MDEALYRHSNAEDHHLTRGKANPEEPETETKAMVV